MCWSFVNFPCSILYILIVFLSPCARFLVGPHQNMAQGFFVGGEDSDGPVRRSYARPMEQPKIRVQRAASRHLATHQIVFRRRRACPTSTTRLSRPTVKRRPLQQRVQAKRQLLTKCKTYEKYTQPRQGVQAVDTARSGRLPAFAQIDMQSANACTRSAMQR